MRSPAATEEAAVALSAVGHDSVRTAPEAIVVFAKQLKPEVPKVVLVLVLTLGGSSIPWARPGVNRPSEVAVYVVLSGDAFLDRSLVCV
jgi:hypothetical protein